MPGSDGVPCISKASSYRGQSDRCQFESPAEYVEYIYGICKCVYAYDLLSIVNFSSFLLPTLC